jgi:hypothetical protein
MTAWLATKALGLARGWWLLGAALALAALAWWLSAAEKADDKANRELGATVERERSLAEAIERTEKANEAREEISRAGPVGDKLRYDQCLRSARTPENCRRFLPQ